MQKWWAYFRDTKTTEKLVSEGSLLVLMLSWLRPYWFFDTPPKMASGVHPHHTCLPSPEVLVKTDHALTMTRTRKTCQRGIRITVSVWIIFTLSLLLCDNHDYHCNPKARAGISFLLLGSVCSWKHLKTVL